MKHYTSNYETFLSYKSDIDSFYKNLNGTKFTGITKEKLIELYKNSLQLNNFFNNANAPYNKASKYVKIMNRIKTNSKEYGATSEAEKFIAFMFAVDPYFEAAKIHGSLNHIDETKIELKRYFGIFGLKLVILENYFIKNFLTKEKRNQIYEEIEQRAFYGNSKKK